MALCSMDDFKAAADVFRQVLSEQQVRPSPGPDNTPLVTRWCTCCMCSRQLIYSLLRLVRQLHACYAHA